MELICAWNIFFKTHAIKRNSDVLFFFLNFCVNRTCRKFPSTPISQGKARDKYAARDFHVKCDAINVWQSILAHFIVAQHFAKSFITAHAQKCTTHNTYFWFGVFTNISTGTNLHHVLGNDVWLAESGARRHLSICSRNLNSTAAAVAIIVVFGGWMTLIQ